MDFFSDFSFTLRQISPDEVLIFLMKRWEYFLTIEAFTSLTGRGRNIILELIVLLTTIYMRNIHGSSALLP